MRLPRLGVESTLGHPCGLIRVEGCGEGGNLRSEEMLAGQLSRALITSMAEHPMQIHVVLQFLIIQSNSENAVHQNILCGHTVCTHNKGNVCTPHSSYEN